MEKIGIVGAGLIGSSWSAIFSSKGFDVVIYDSNKNVENEFKKRVATFLEELKFIDNKINIEDSLQNIKFVHDINYLSSNCTFIQACSPEIVEIKQELFSKLDNSCPENVILSSSSSGMPISLITQNLKGKNRCIISHPVNPPHLIPCVEISPSLNTSEGVINKTKDIFGKIGFSIVYVKKEIDGFILNRLQGALLNEAVKLYSEGYASADHIDSTVRNGLGLRWAFMGPFETIDLNAPGGIKHYMQRTAIQGHPSTVTAITKQYQIGAKQNIDGPHVFRKYFEEIQIGDTVITDKHLVTLDNIEEFAELSGDKFYAHMDENSLDGTIFTERVAHGYFIMSKAAGLFVDPPKGPVLLNYGIDECRFTKPVYPGMTIGVRFTAKEKITQEKKDENDIAKGIVKFLVDVYDDENDTVMLATILTMVKMKDQS